MKTENKCCSNCINYNNAQCDFLKKGLITQVRLTNADGQAVSNTDFNIYHTTCITSEFAKMMRCNKWKETNLCQESQ